jgi:protoporphyrinogen oxidase
MIHTSLIPNITPLNNFLTNSNFIKSTFGLKVYKLQYYYPLTESIFVNAIRNLSSSKLTGEIESSISKLTMLQKL